MRTVGVDENWGDFIATDSKDRRSEDLLCSRSDQHLHESLRFKAKAGKNKMVLELGENAASFVDEDTDLDDAVR